MHSVSAGSVLRPRAVPLPLPSPALLCCTHCVALLCRGPVGSSPAAVAAAGAVFGAVMEAALRDAAAGAHEDAGGWLLWGEPAGSCGMVLAAPVE